jgi:RimJ/RimL family protein N-acetyltransferase
LGYFVDERFWGIGIASEAIKLAEKVGFTALRLKRIEILIVRKNKASLRAAVKCEYKKEGILRKKILLNDKFHDACLYAKVEP